MVALHRTGAGDRLGSVQIESAEEHRQSTEQNAFSLGQQAVRPLHRGAQRLLAAHRCARTAGQRAEAVMQTVDDLGQPQRAHPRRRKFNRQRYAVEAAADLRHGRGVVVGHAEVALGQAGAVGEQLDGFVGQ